MKTLRRLVGVGVALYALSTIVILLLRLTIGERWDVIARLNTGLHLVLAPTLILFPVTLLARLPRIACLLLPAVLTLVIHYAGLFLPQTITVPPAAPRFTLLTYNLHSETEAVQPLIDLVRAVNADVVIVQELSGVAAEHFDAQLADQYPYRFLHPVLNPYNGRGLLSRYPVVDEQTWPEVFPIPVRLQRATIEIGDTPVTLYNLHAPPSFPIWGEPLDHRPRAQQIADLLEMAAADSGAVILAGDFNISDFDENYAHITATYTDSFRAVGLGLHTAGLVT